MRKDSKNSSKFSLTAHIVKPSPRAIVTAPRDDLLVVKSAFPKSKVKNRNHKLIVLWHLRLVSDHSDPEEKN